jgi:anti-sigma factor RsiW
MSQACAAWRGDIGAYVVGALSPQAGARVRRHLETCQACRADYQDLALVRDWLELAALPHGESSGYVPGRPPQAPFRRGASRARWLWPAAAAAFATTVAVIAAHLAPVFDGYVRASGASWRQLRATRSGTQIYLTISGLSVGQRCILVAVSSAGAERGRHPEHHTLRHRAR